jgi:CheY-like chemotaxis protein
MPVNATREYHGLFEQASMNDVVTKPFKHADLLSCLAQWLPTQNTSR